MLSFSAFAVHQIINKVAGSVLPSVLQRALLEGIFKVGRAQLSESLLNENNPLGSSRLSKLKHIFEEGKSLQLQFPAEDLGFRCQLHFHNNLSALHMLQLLQSQIPFYINLILEKSIYSVSQTWEF